MMTHSSLARSFFRYDPSVERKRRCSLPTESEIAEEKKRLKTAKVAQEPSDRFQPYVIEEEDCPIQTENSVKKRLSFPTSLRKENRVEASENDALGFKAKKRTTSPVDSVNVEQDGSSSEDAAEKKKKKKKRRRRTTSPVDSVEVEQDGDSSEDAAEKKKKKKRTSAVDSVKVEQNGDSSEDSAEKKKKKKRTSAVDSGELEQDGDSSEDAAEKKKKKRRRASAVDSVEVEQDGDSSEDAAEKKKKKKRRRASAVDSAEEEKDGSSEAAVCGGEVRSMLEEVSAHFLPEDATNAGGFFFNFDLSDEETPPTVPRGTAPSEDPADSSKAKRLSGGFFCFSFDNEDFFSARATAEEQKMEWDRQRPRLRDVVRSAVKNAVWKAKEARHGRNTASHVSRFKR